MYSTLKNATLNLNPDDYDGLTPEDLSEEAIRRYVARVHWRETHTVEHSTYADPTFRQVISRIGGERPKPATRAQRRARAQRVIAAWLADQK